MIRIYETMNIYSKPGHKVKVTKCSSKNGYPHDSAKIQEFLTIGKIYTVKEIEVDAWYSTVILTDFPDERFNTVCFEDVNKITNSKK